MLSDLDHYFDVISVVARSVKVVFGAGPVADQRGEKPACISTNNIDLHAEILHFSKVIYQRLLFIVVQIDLTDFLNTCIYVHPHRTMIGRSSV